MKRFLTKADTEMKTIISDNEVIQLSPTALKLFMHILNNPAGQYSTGELRRLFGACPTRNLRPYFEELQEAGLLEAEFSYGVVSVGRVAKRIDTAYGMPVFESCKKEEA